jgi:hypothetical protein
LACFCFVPNLFFNAVAKILICFLLFHPIPIPCRHQFIYPHFSFIFYSFLLHSCLNFLFLFFILTFSCVLLVCRPTECSMYVVKRGIMCDD